MNSIPLFTDLPTMIEALTICVNHRAKVFADPALAEATVRIVNEIGEVQQTPISAFVCKGLTSFQTEPILAGGAGAAPPLDFSSAPFPCERRRDDGYAIALGQAPAPQGAHATRRAP